MTSQEMVEEFHRTFGCYVADIPSLPPTNRRKLRVRLIQEELNELGASFDDDDLTGVADAIADLLVVVYGTAVECGLDADALVAEVHRSNMSKLGEDGKPIIREDGKVLKGPNYSPPDLRPMIHQ